MAEILDIDTLLANLGGDEQMADRLLGIFVDSTDALFHHVEQLLAAGAISPSVWQEKLHLLKGAALNVAAIPLAQLAAATQDATLESAGEYAACFAPLRAAYDELRSVILMRISS